MKSLRPSRPRSRVLSSNLDEAMIEAAAAAQVAAAAAGGADNITVAIGPHALGGEKD
jgi:hypothetical protein